MPPRRKYELKKRAEEMAETHLRITEAAIELHGTVGPARTTLSAVAKRAGVERRTLYRHFPTEADLFDACSTHYFAANPWPDLAGWRAIRDPERAARARPRRALRLLRAHRADARQRAARRGGRGVRPRRRGAAARVPRGGRRGARRRPVGPRPEATARSGLRCATSSPSRRGARCRPTASGARMPCGSASRWSKPPELPGRGHLLAPVEEAIVASSRTQSANVSVGPVQRSWSMSANSAISLRSVARSLNSSASSRRSPRTASGKPRSGRAR